MYLPDIFKQFVDQYPEIAEAYQKVGDLCSSIGPLDEKTQHLIQLGVSIGACSKGGVRSHARRAVAAGASPDEVMQVALLSMTIIGFPATIASYDWLQGVLADPGEK